ncbi:hypothetical protein ASPSYDRAFT_304158 [Aspergillus sydowii CBS 593.65]|uniref:Uncharacterized protein n=1 Tax=Aspergillus sydowii CBS 593.65 TaxID=1036612 RepID=A0A1L9TY34_9EURO|nr:uncharacterized protein ASPSYDRAFT_304158 [Aspergillus sydowii CBS 593.65]OJJ64347.1 hypothetical protein ASPSYDRAFT_304158 [Aspergillus sydowii CBS 593.65]
MVLRLEQTSEMTSSGCVFVILHDVRHQETETRSPRKTEAMYIFCPITSRTKPTIHRVTIYLRQGFHPRQPIIPHRVERGFTSGGVGNKTLLASHIFIFCHPFINLLLLQRRSR